MIEKVVNLHLNGGPCEVGTLADHGLVSLQNQEACFKKSSSKKASS